MTAGAAIGARIRAALAACATPRGILIAGYAVFVLYAYPGYMTTEAADQLFDARTGQFTDWHSPVMSEVWALIECMIAGPAGMLVLQSGLFLLGAYHVLRRAMPARPAAIAAACVLVFPPVMAAMAVIGRDSQMVGYLMAGTAAVASPRRALRFVGLGLFGLACAMRGSAAVAALPVIACSFAWRDGLRGWTRVAIACAAWAVVALGAAWLDAALVDAPSQREAVTRATDDIVGVLRYGEPIGDAELARTLAGTGLAVTEGIQARARADARRSGPDRLFDPPATPAARAALLAARDSLVREHRGAYLAARWHVVYRMLGVSRGSRLQPVYTRFAASKRDAVTLSYDGSHGWIQDRLAFAARWVGRSFLCRPYLYLALAIALLPVAVVRRQRCAALVLISGIAHEVSLFELATAVDYRASLWMISSAVFAAALLIGAWRSEAGRDASPRA